jgi:ABC-type sugar transport system substrate-binding protein
MSLRKYSASHFERRTKKTIDQELQEEMQAEIDTLIARGLIAIIHQQPDEATMAAREAAGYDIARLFDGRMAWVHQSVPPWDYEE